MTQLQTIALGMIQPHIGKQVVLPTADKTKATFTLTSVDHVDGMMVLGLNAVEVQLAADCKVRVWDAKTKVAHIRCSCCNKTQDHPSIEVPAAGLVTCIGSYIFVDGGTACGPHKLLDAYLSGGEVVVRFSAEEAIAPIDFRVQVDTCTDMRVAA